MAALIAAGTERRGAVRHLLGRVYRIGPTRSPMLLAATWGPSLATAGLAILYFIYPPSAGPEFPPLTRWVVGLLVIAPVLVTLEEIGWRGYALPRLQSRFDALLSSLLLGVVHAIWHLPLYWIPESGRGPFSVANALIFLGGILPGAIVLTSLFNATMGGLPAVIVAHVSYNLFVNAVTLPESDQRKYLLLTVVAAIAVAAGIVRRYGRETLAPAPRVLDE